jgi:hypothetical protein
MQSFKLPKGIAKNHALMENVMSLFIAIQTQIPLFLTGLPGSSKTLSLNTVLENMIGKDSSNSLLRKQKTIYPHYY